MELAFEPRERTSSPRFFFSEGSFNILYVTQDFNPVFCNFKKFLVIVTKFSKVFLS